MAQPMPLIEQIFGKLSVTYGREFLNRWEGLDLAVVKADWADQLDGLTTASIRHGLSALDPLKPPTVLAFRNLCLQAPPPEMKRLPGPEASPEAVARAKEALDRVRRQIVSSTRWHADARDGEAS